MMTTEGMFLEWVGWLGIACAALVAGVGIPLALVYILIYGWKSFLAEIRNFPPGLKTPRKD